MHNHMTYEQPKELTLNEALMTISAARQSLEVMGALDSERDFLNELESDLKGGNITPKEALAKLNDMESKRMGTSGEQAGE